MIRVGMLGDGIAMKGHSEDGGCQVGNWKRRWMKRGWRQCIEAMQLQSILQKDGKASVKADSGGAKQTN